MVIDSDRMIFTNIKLPVISVVKPRSGRKLKMILKLILAKLLFYIQSLLRFKFISKYSKQISQSFILCILMRRITCTTMDVFSQKGRACFFGICYTFKYKLIGLSLH